MLPIKFRIRQINRKNGTAVIDRTVATLNWSPATNMNDACDVVLRRMLYHIRRVKNHRNCDFVISVYNSSVPDHENQPRALIYEMTIGKASALPKHNRVFRHLVRWDLLAAECEALSAKHKSFYTKAQRKTDADYKKEVQKHANLNRSVKVHRSRTVKNFAQYLAKNINPLEKPASY